MLEGKLGFRVGEEKREIAAGESILVERGVEHSYWNAASEHARWVRDGASDPSQLQWLVDDLAALARQVQAGRLGMYLWLSL